MLRSILRTQKLPFQVIRLLRNAPRAVSPKAPEDDLKDVSYRIPDSQPISQEFSADQAKSVMVPNKSSDSSLVITADQTDVIDSRLRDKNFKSLIDKQAEIKNVMRAIDSPFLLFYLVEKHHGDFGSANLLSLLNKLALCKFQANRALPIPREIKQIFTRLVLKLAPYFQPDQSLNALKRLSQLDLTLGDPSVQSMVQLLKYQVNQLEVHELVFAKQLLTKLSQEAVTNTTRPADSFSQELVSNLEKAIELAAKLNQRKLEMYSTSEHWRTMLAFIKQFHHVMGRQNLEETLQYLAKSLLTNWGSEELLSILEIYAKYGFCEHFVLKRLTYSIKHKLDVKMRAKEDQAFQEAIHERLSALVPYFAKHRFFDQALVDTLWPRRMRHYESELERLESAVSDDERQRRLGDMVAELNGLFGFGLKFEIYSPDLVDVVNRAYFESRAKRPMESQDVQKLFEERFKFSLLKEYLAKCTYTKLSDKDLEHMEALVKPAAKTEIFV